MTTNKLKNWTEPKRGQRKTARKWEVGVKMGVKGRRKLEKQRLNNGDKYDN